MEILLGILLLLAGAGMAALCLLPDGNGRTHKSRRKRDIAQEREAHYMRNFRTYDGGVQEEFEE